MKKKINVKVCRGCAEYRAFFRKGLFCFWMARKGLCSDEKIVDENNSCEYWSPRSNDTVVTIEILDSAIEDIKVLIKIYENDNYAF